MLNPGQPPLDAFQCAATDPAIAPDLQEVLKRCGESVAFFSLGSDTDKERLLVFISKQPFVIPDETMQIGHELATQISLVISSAMLHDETRRYSQAQSALLSANRSVMAANETSLRDVLIRSPAKSWISSTPTVAKSKT